MPEGSSHKPGGNESEALINIPDSVRKSLPSDFNISDIGKIDLREAESIAREDILFLNESDLIEGLEDFDLIPLKGVEEAEPRADIAGAGPARAARERGTGTAVSELPEPGGDVEAEFGEDASPETELELDGGGEWLSLEKPEKIDGEGRKTALPEKRPRDDDKETAGVPAATVEEKRIAPPPAREKEAIDRPPAGEEPSPVPRERKRLSEGYVEGDDEYVIWDMSDSEAVIAEPVSGAAPLPMPREKEAGKKSEVIPAAKEKISAEDREVVISLEELELEPVLQDEVRETAAVKAAPFAVERESAVAREEISAAPASPDMTREVKQPVALEEEAPGRYFRPESSAAEVVFIDDRQKAPDAGTEIFEESDLDKIITGMFQIDEGSAQILGEAKADEDRERIAALTEELVPAYEDLSVDLDYKYGDDELDYIHTAIVEEDFGGYMREIDDFFGSRGGKTVPTSLELLGLTADEFDTIEDLLFKEEFKDIHLYDRYHLYEFDRAGREGSPREQKRVKYLLPKEHSLVDVERDSIESDVSSGSALIFEEDVEDIRKQLVEKTGMTDAEVVSMVEQTFVSEIVPEEFRVEETPMDKAPSEKPAPEEVPAGGGVFDITDRVVILDDEADVERFVNGFPEQKRINIKMLLKYLDGLFERLPEEIIRKFASSEYFELYLKVLNELGV